jgi:hypothetical protein
LRRGHLISSADPSATWVLLPASASNNNSKKSLGNKEEPVGRTVNWKITGF